jgi:tetratricopeptide (TPR) repeat protein
VRAKQLLAEIEEKRRQEEIRQQEERRRREKQDREVAAVQTLIQERKYGEATQLLNKAMAAEVFERSDVRAKQLLAEIEEKRKQEKTKREQEKRDQKRRREEAKKQQQVSIEHTSEPAEATADTSRRGHLVPLLAIAAFVTFGITYIVRQYRPRPPAEVKLKEESQDLRKQGRLDEAIERDKEIVRLQGSLASWANQDIGSIEKLKEDIMKLKSREDDLMAQGKTAEEQRNYPLAKQDYEEVISLQGSRMMEAEVAKKYVEEIIEKMAQSSFDDGKAALDQHNYDAAEKFFREALTRAPGNWPPRSQVQALLTKATHLLAQQDIFERAKNDFARRQFDSALVEATQALNAPDGNSLVQGKAQELIQRIRRHNEQNSQYLQAEGLEHDGRAQAKDAYEKVLSFPEGDNDIENKARAALERLKTKRPPLPPPPPDYSKVVGEIVRLIRNRQFAEAEVKLRKDLPENQSQYEKLQVDIRDGLEDEAFAQNKKTYQVNSPKDKNSLGSLRSFFEGEAKKPGRHREEAKTIMAEIDQTLNSIRQQEEEAAIRAVLWRYAKAIDNGDRVGIEAVRDISPKEWKDLANTKGQGLQIEPCSPPVIQGDTATLTCTDLLTNVKGSRSWQVQYVLKRINGQWKIVRNK